MIKTKYGNYLKLYIDFFDKDWVTEMEKDIKRLKKKGLIDSASKEYLDMIKPRWKDLKKRGYYTNEKTTIDNFINNTHSETFDMYSRVPPIHQFFDKGVDGETHLDKIFENKLDCFENGARDIVKIWRTAQMIDRQIQSRPSLRRKLEDIEEEDQLGKSKPVMTKEHLVMMRKYQQESDREQHNYKNELI